MNNVVSFIYPKGYIDKIDNKIKSLGYSNKLTTSSFIITRLIIECIIFLVFILVPVYGLILSILFVVLFHFVYEDILINSKLISRNNKIMNDALLYFNMLLLSINSYKSIDDLLLISSNSINNSFTKELKVAIKGKNYQNALLDLGNYIPNSIISEYLKDMSICKNINELESIINNLLVELDRIKDEEITKKINILPFKFTILMILFLVVVITLLIVVPKYL